MSALIGIATAILALSGMPNLPENTDGSPATCSSQVVADVEVDNCVAGPDAPTYGDAPRLEGLSDKMRSIFEIVVAQHRGDGIAKADDLAQRGSGMRATVH